MVYLTGDTHIPIDISKLNTTNFPEQRNLTRDDYVIILGDFGLYWHKDKTYEHWRKWLQEKPFTILWPDGNHENHEWINSMPMSRWHGGDVHVDKNIIHLMRGQVYTIEGKKFFVMGGATSHDKECRQEGVSWWAGEEVSYGDTVKAAINLGDVDWRVDYILTHDCPEEIAYDMFNASDYQKSPTRKFLSMLDKNIVYKKWFFGHWHIDKKYGAYNCLYNSIVKLEEET